MISRFATTVAAAALLAGSAAAVNGHVMSHSGVHELGGPPVKSTTGSSVNLGQ